MRHRIAGLFLLSLAAAACAPPSLLVPANDPVFARAQARERRTAAAVDALAAPPDERALFLQAEALYDYRFEFQRRSFWGYFAEGAASVTDFPALQSFSSSLDLADLRLQSYGGAIQLWETLLARHPDSKLAPLALYRLGWAYRCTDVRGFPRKSGDAAFDALRREYPGTPLALLAADARQTRWKSKKTAAAWSILPGAGQMYEGRIGNGTVRLGIGLASAAMVVAPIWVGYERRRDLRWDRDWPLLATGTLGAIVVSLDYTTAYQDAMRGAIEINERSEAAFEDAHPDAP